MYISCWFTALWNFITARASHAKEQFWKNVGEHKKPKFHRERKGKKSGKKDKDGEDTSTTANSDVSMSPTSTNSDQSELTSQTSTASLPVLNELPQQPQPLESLPSKPDFAVDKVAHKAVRPEWNLPGLPGKDSLGEWQCLSSDEESAGEDLHLPPSQMSFVKWPTAEMPAPVDFSSLLNTGMSGTARPVVDMPAPVNFGFLLSGEQPDIQAKHVELPPNGPATDSAIQPLDQDLAEFLESSEQWADTFVQPEQLEAASPEDSGFDEGLPFADTFVENEISEELPTSQAHGSEAGIHTLL